MATRKAATRKAATRKSVNMIVRRGAVRRFEALTLKTADLPVIVSWDRRSEDRRASREAAPVERRSGDRRKAPPFTWDTADFVVVDAGHDAEPPRVERRSKNAGSNGKTSVNGRTRKRRK